MEPNTRYNVGAGIFKRDGWTNLDLASDHYAPQQSDFVEYDLTSGEPLPIADASATIIYCSHVIEHVPDADVERLLAESYRALMPGGVLRLVTPDIDLAFAAYLNNDIEFFRAYYPTQHIDHPQQIGLNIMPSEATAAQLFIHAVASQLSTMDRDPCGKVTDEVLAESLQERGTAETIDMMCRITKPGRPENHRNWFSDAKLAGMMSRVGFATVYRSGWMQSRHPEMRDYKAFDPHPTISLFMEAIR